MFSCQALSSEEVLLVNLKSPPQTSLYYIRLQVTLVIGNVNSSSLLHKLMARVQTLLCNHCLSLFPTALPFKRLGSISNFLSGLMNRGQQARHRLSSRSLIAKQPTPPPWALCFTGCPLSGLRPKFSTVTHTHTHSSFFAHFTVSNKLLIPTFINILPICPHQAFTTTQRSCRL